MDVAHLIALNLAFLAAMASPVPAMLLSIRATLTGDRAHGIITGLGPGTEAASWIGQASLGMNARFTLLSRTYRGTMAAGAIFSSTLLLRIIYTLFRWPSRQDPLATAISASNRFSFASLLPTWARSDCGACSTAEGISP